MTISSWLNFGRPAPPGRGGTKFFKFDFNFKHEKSRREVLQESITSLTWRPGLGSTKLLRRSIVHPHGWHDNHILIGQPKAQPRVQNSRNHWLRLLNCCRTLFAMRYSSALPDTMKESSNQAIQLRHRSFRRLITDVPDFHTTLYTNNKQRLTV